MGNFRQFPEERQRLQLEEDEAARIAQEFFASARGGSVDEEFDWTQAKAEPEVHAHLHREQYGLMQVSADRTAIYPEHLMIGAIWLGAIALGLWRIII
ncbi:hypothetical protein EOE18_17605 [Novosphingobium umbonatum]|jgi:hypothetical protein|uniref:Uncharacterized protein n=1 Tax=Novosphingobium umbonatum TaxID=1908524 RepID=A0A437MX34_9SPHN|nr:hypothetical protein [Novosphingobium umbonatum]RVU02232.1 hypothetical protein EOE18_17605 [Novosphingobium umbonatum]